MNLKELNKKIKVIDRLERRKRKLWEYEFKISQEVNTINRQLELLESYLKEIFGGEQ